MDPLEYYSATANETLEVSEPINIQHFLNKWKNLLSEHEYLLPDCPSLPLKSLPDAEALLPSTILDELFSITKYAMNCILLIRWLLD